MRKQAVQFEGIVRRRPDLYGYQPIYEIEKPAKPRAIGPKPYRHEHPGRGKKLLQSDVHEIRRRFGEFVTDEQARLRKLGLDVHRQTIRDVILGQTWAWPRAQPGEAEAERDEGHCAAERPPVPVAPALSTKRMQLTPDRVLAIFRDGAWHDSSEIRACGISVQAWCYWRRRLLADGVVFERRGRSRASAYRLVSAGAAHRSGAQRVCAFLRGGELQPAEQLAAVARVSVATVRATVLRLRKLGYRVETVSDGPTCGYRLASHESLRNTTEAIA